MCECILLGAVNQGQSPFCPISPANYTVPYRMLWREEERRITSASDTFSLSSFLASHPQTDELWPENHCLPYCTQYVMHEYCIVRAIVAKGRKRRSLREINVFERLPAAWQVRRKKRENKKKASSSFQVKTLHRTLMWYTHLYGININVIVYYYYYVK